jgi:hypothetical protein
MDFVIQRDGKLIPIEVKSADNINAKSLRIYIQKFKPEYAGKMQFYLMWANHDATNAWDIRNSDQPGGECVVWKGDTDRGEFAVVCRRVIEKYFRQPNYYKIGGAPVFEIYDLNNLVKGLGGADKTREALDRFRAETVKAGFPGLHLQLTVWSAKMAYYSSIDAGRTHTDMEMVGLLGFDSVTHYQLVHFLDIDREYPDIVKDAESEWRRIGAASPVPYFPHVSIGWDANPRWKPFRPGIVRGNTPAEFEKALRAAKAYADAHPEQPPLITLNSWNEWTEVSYLEPDDLYGYGYLEAVKKVFM